MHRILITLLFVFAGAAPAAAQSQDKLAELEQAIAAEKFGQITSITVRQGDDFAWERHFDGGSPDTLRNTRSVTKTITGALVGIAIAEGHIASLDAKVLSFFPEYRPANPDSRKSEMALGDLITMTGPLECNDWNEYSRGNEERMYPIEDWIGFFLDLPIGAPPPWEPRAEERPYGKVFSYCTAGVFTLGRIVEKATGRELEDYAREKLFDPLGIGEVKWPFSPEGIAQGGGGMELTPRDLAEFARLYIDKGMANGQRILSEDWAVRSVTPHAQIDDSADYGYLWWLYEVPSGEARAPLWMMNGSGGNKVVALPHLDAVAVITTTNFRRSDAHRLSERILLEYIVPALEEREGF